MTDELQAQINQIKAATNIQQARARSEFRPKNRSPLMDFEGVLSLVRTYKPSGTRLDGTAWENDKPVMVIRVDNLVVHDAVVPVMGSTAEFEIPLSDRSNSGLGYMVSSALEQDSTVQDFMDLTGRPIRLQDAVVPAPTHKDGTPVLGKDGYPLKATWFYKVSSLGPKSSKASSNGHAAPSKEAFSAALEILNGKTADEFAMAAVKDERVRADQAMVNAIVSGGFLKGAIADGLVSIEGNGYVVRETAGVPF